VGDVYAVIFTSTRSAADDGYASMAERMFELARKQEGFLGVDSVREGRSGITVSYWTSLDAIDAWKKNAEHILAQREGRRTWYDAYRVVVARVERQHDFERDRDDRA
jgi:heme-degrading monooxygenase HmoA